LRFSFEQQIVLSKSKSKSGSGSGTQQHEKLKEKTEFYGQIVFDSDPDFDTDKR